MKEKTVEVKKVMVNGECFNSKLSCILKKYKHLNPGILNKGLVAPESLSENSILFIGINFADGGLDEKYIAGYDKSCKTWYVDLNKIKKDYDYYQKFSEIVDEEWTHLDLFFFIATKQAEVDDFLETKEGKKFMQEQLNLSKALLELSKPKLIVVANAKARDIFKDGYNGIGPLFECKPDEEIGTYRIQIDGKNVPVFFTSMLSGQRALDNGSFERLKWHIKCVLDGRKMIKLSNYKPACDRINTAIKNMISNTVVALNVNKSLPVMGIAPDRPNIYECTRKYWYLEKVNQKVFKARYACGHDNGRIVSVYECPKWKICEWPEKPYQTRYEFTGTEVTDESIIGELQQLFSDKYKPRSQNPVQILQ
jgi:hypothetical protein